MNRFPLLAAAAFLLAASPAPALSPTAVTKALAACLHFPDVPLAAGLRMAERPPGLIGKDRVEATRLPGNGGRAIVYAGTAHTAITCGIALYGPVPPGLVGALRRTIASNQPSMRPFPTDRYKVEAPDAAASYWGDVRAPGLTGVLMLTRTPRDGAPTVEVQYHSLLVP